MSTESAALPLDANQPAASLDRFARWRIWTRPAIIANLIGQILIVLSGGLVRLTGSGLGCSTWPQCEPGRFTPEYHDAVSFHPYVEFGNRLVSVVLVLVAVVVALLVWTTYQRSKSLRAWGLVPLIGVVLQGVIGGITVLIELHPAIVGGHLLISMALVALSTYLLVRWDGGDGRPRIVVNRSGYVLSRVVGALMVPVLVLGVVVTGSGPHSGDTEVGYRFGFDPAVVTRFHSISVWLFLAALVAAAVLLLKDRSTPTRVRKALRVLVILTVAQGLVGYIQYFTNLPVALVALHMLAAAGMAAAVTWFVLTTRERAEFPSA